MNKNTWIKYKQLLPLVLLTIYFSPTLYYWMVGVITYENQAEPFSPSSVNYLAILIILINYIVFISAPKFFKFVFIPTLVLGFFNLISFTTFDETFSMSVNGGSKGIEIQPAAVFAVIFTYILNFKRFNNFILEKQ